MKKIRLILNSFLVVLIGIYAFGAYYYHNHTYPNTTYNGNNYGDLTKEELKARLDKNETTDIVLTEGNFSEVIKGKDIAYTHTYDVEGVDVNSTFLAWPIQVAKAHDLGEIPHVQEYNVDLLKEKIQNSDLATKVNRVASQDAKVVLGDGKYFVAPETYGNALDMDKLITAVVTSVNNSTPAVDVKKVDPYIPPKVFADDQNLKKEAEFRNRWKDTEIMLNLDGVEIPLIDYTTDSGFRTNQEENYEEHNTENITKVVSELAEKYNSLYIERSFKTSHGDTITPDPGNFGYQIDEDTLWSLISENLFQGNKAVIDVPFIYTGHDIKDDSKIGDTYVEIDLSTQELFVYKDGKKVLQTVIVSGNVNIDGRATPAGTFQVLAKTRDTVLSSSVPGDTYSVPVSFWMPFTDEGHGLHDASWVYDFGGDLYQYVGSHGCINMMYDDVSMLFDLIDVGTPVVIYRSGNPPSKTYLEKLYEEEESGTSESGSDEESSEEGSDE